MKTIVTILLSMLVFTLLAAAGWLVWGLVRPLYTAEAILQVRPLDLLARPGAEAALEDTLERETRSRARLIKANSILSAALAT